MLFTDRWSCEYALAPPGLPVWWWNVEDLLLCSKVASETNFNTFLTVVAGNIHEAEFFDIYAIFAIENYLVKIYSENYLLGWGSLLSNRRFGNSTENWSTWFLETSTKLWNFFMERDLAFHHHNCEWILEISSYHSYQSCGLLSEKNFHAKWSKLTIDLMSVKY